MEGNVWALVDLEDRIKVRYVDYQDYQILLLKSTEGADLENGIHNRFVR